MNKIYLLILCMCMYASGALCAAGEFVDFSDEYQFLLKDFREKASLFRADHDEKSFNLAKGVAERLMLMGPQDPRPYVGMWALYVHAGGAGFDELESYSNALAILDRYESISGEKYDISDLRKQSKTMIRDRKDYERVQAYTKQMEDDADQPIAVLLSQELIQLYANDYNPAHLVEAIDELNKALLVDPVNYKLFLALVRVYEVQDDFINAYVMWELTINFGVKESFLVESRTVHLYQTALEYQRKYSVSIENPGPDRSLFFLWLHRKDLFGALTERGLDMLEEKEKGGSR